MTKQTFEEQMKEARKRALLNHMCDGTENCKAEHHLVCCLSLKK